MPKSTHRISRSTVLRAVVAVVCFGAATAVLLRNWQTVSLSISFAQHAQLAWLLTGLLLMTLTFCIAAGIYGVLALHKLRFRETLLIEVSTAFVNRLLPSGLGGLGLHGIYLFKRRHTPAEATILVSVNNLLGIVAHLLLLGTVLIFKMAIVNDIFHLHELRLPWQVLGICMVLLLAVPVLPPARSKVVRFAHNLLVSLRKLHPSALLKGIILALFMTMTYTLILFCAARSIGVQLGVLQLFIIFSLGMLAATATPTPGGLVGAEAGLYAGFIAYGISPAQAGAAVLLYRLLSYCLPLLPGVLALGLARRAKLV